MVDLKIFRPCYDKYSVLCPWTYGLEHLSAKLSFDVIFLSQDRPGFLLKIEVTILELWFGIILVMLRIQSSVHGLTRTFSAKLLFDALSSPRTDQEVPFKIEVTISELWCGMVARLISIFFFLQYYPIFFSY